VAVTGGTPTRLSKEEQKAGAVSKARVSPDGKQIATLMLAGAGETGGQAVLSVVSVADHKARVLAKLNGGKGTLSESPWSPDGKRLTFVSYQEIAPLR
jgi:Tol biopolymer transport system component